MLEYLTRRGFTVRLTLGMVLLSRKDRPNDTWDYPSLKAAYAAHGGPKGHIQYLGGRA